MKLLFILLFGSIIILINACTGFKINNCDCEGFPDAIETQIWPMHYGDYWEYQGYDSHGKFSFKWITDMIQKVQFESETGTKLASVYPLMSYRDGILISEKMYYLKCKGKLIEVELLANNIVNVNDVITDDVKTGDKITKNGIVKSTCISADSIINGIHYVIYQHNYRFGSIGFQYYIKGIGLFLTEYYDNGKLETRFQLVECQINGEKKKFVYKGE
jgi:hypothetical protein